MSMLQFILFHIYLCPVLMHTRCLRDLSAPSFFFCLMRALLLHAHRCTAWGASEDPSRPVADDCCVCGLSDFAPGNDVLFCGDGAGCGCDGAFHQQCYGVSVVPQGDWYCRTCLSQTPVPPEPVPVAKVVDAAKNSAVSPSKKAVASARSDRDDDDDDDDEDDDDDFETSVQDSAEEAVKSSEEAGSLQPATAAGSATAQDEVDETAAAAAAADVEWLTTLQLAASVRGSDAIADAAKLRALDLAAAAAAEGNASEVEACATASNSHNNSSNGSAGPAAEASALEAMSTCHEFVSLCAFFDRFQWPAVGHGHLALALAPDAAARVGGGGEGGEGSGSSAGKAAAVAAQSSSTFSAEFLGGLAASMLARVQGKPASAYPAEKWEAALSAALQYMDERDGATLEEAEKEDDDNHDSNDKGKRLGKESEMGSEGATKGEHDATWLAELSGGSRVEVKLSDGEWVKGTIARLYKSTGRADVTLDPAAGNKDDNSDVDDDEEVVVDEEHGVDRTKLRPPSASAFTPGAEPATNLSSSSSSSSSSSTDATPQPLLLSMRPFDRARALSRLVDETLTFPPPDLLGALRTLAKEAPEALRDAPLGFDRLGRGYYYLEDHVGGILVVRTSPSKLPPLVAPLSTSLSDNAGGAKTDANAGDKKTKGKSEAATAPGKGAGKSKGGGAKGGGAGTFAWSAKAAKKKLAEEAAAAKAIAKSAADAVAAAVARREELLASLEAQDDNTGDTSQNDGTLISSSSSSGNKDGSRNILSGSSSSSSSSTSRGRSEVLCSGEAGVQALIAALATTQDPSELWLWRNLSQEVLPRLAALAAEKVRLEKKAERGQRRLAKANKELERLSSRMDSVDEHGGGGGRSRGRGGKVDYTFSSYDRAMKDATRDW